MNAEVKQDRREVHCLRASLSEHDLDPVARLSALPVSRWSVSLGIALGEADVLQGQ